MTFPLLRATNYCFGKLNDMYGAGHKTAVQRIVAATILLDAGLLISGVVLGALGMVHIIPMPGIAAYSLFALSGAVALAWMVAAAATKGKAVKEAVHHVRTVLNCCPKNKYVLVT